MRRLAAHRWFKPLIGTAVVLVVASVFVGDGCSCGPSPTEAYWMMLYGDDPEEQMPGDPYEVVKYLDRAILKIETYDRQDVDQAALDVGNSALALLDSTARLIRHLNWMNENRVKTEVGRLVGGDASPKCKRLINECIVKTQQHNQVASDSYSLLMSRYPGSQFERPQLLSTQELEELLAGIEQEDQISELLFNVGWMLGMGL